MFINGANEVARPQGGLRPAGPSPEHPRFSARCFIGKTQACFALQEQHPFAFRLVVPEVRRAALAGRNDAFKA